MRRPAPTVGSMAVQNPASFAFRVDYPLGVVDKAPTTGVNMGTEEKSQEGIAQTHRMGEVTGQDQWPYCAPIGGVCVAYEVERRLGDDVGMAILNFILAAGEGARLILQKNKDGFSVQVTEAVLKGREQPLELAHVRALRERLDVGKARGVRRSPHSP